MPDRYLSAQEAADLLGISRSTLYSYVSRGLIRSETADEARRTHRYYRADVERLKDRQQARRQPERRAEGALHWGTPVLESAVTVIDGGALYYRGHDALRLAAADVPFEEVAALLWEADPRNLAAGAAPEVRVSGELPPLARMQMALIQSEARDFAAFDLRPEAVKLTAAGILKVLTAVIAGQAQQPVAHRLWQTWGARPGARELLNMALVLCADHELNVSAFAARTIASAGASPYQVVIGGLAALSGSKHGGHTYRVAALLDEVGRPARAREVIRSRQRRGEGLPGFGHPLYPAGDPRARLLLAALDERFAEDPASRLARAVATAVEEAAGERPTIDFALVTLAGVLEVPEAAITLFALGRAAGWLAHALEGYAAELIRPRARYVGNPPR